MTSLPYGMIRHLFSFLFGAFLLQFTLGVQWIHQLITSLIVYGMMLVLPRKFNTIAVPAFAMLYLVFGHLHRQYTNYLGYDLDFTGAQMVLTQKVYMLAYNLYDGQCLASGKENRAAKKCEAFAVKKLPSLLEFLPSSRCRRWLVVEEVDAPADTTVLWHPRAMFPRVLIRREGGRGGSPSALAIRPEVLADFLAAHDLAPPSKSTVGSRFRRAINPSGKWHPLGSGGALWLSWICARPAAAGDGGRRVAGARAMADPQA